MSGFKDDKGKADLSLLDKDPLWELARVFESGLAKYPKGNYKKGIPLTKYTAAAMRHMTQFNNGEDLDKDTGRSHLMHAAANLFIAYWTLSNKPEFDDRWRPEPVVPKSHSVACPRCNTTWHGISEELVGNIKTCTSCPEEI